jgi:anti-anti-sigma factor
LDAVDHFPTTPFVRAAFADAIRRARTGVIADLSEVSFIDACMLGVLVGAGNHASHLPAGLRLAGVPEHVDRLLRLTGLLASLPSAYPPCVPRQARTEAPQAAMSASHLLPPTRRSHGHASNPAAAHRDRTGHPGPVLPQATPAAWRQ